LIFRSARHAGIKRAPSTQNFARFIRQCFRFTDARRVHRLRTEFPQIMSKNRDKFFLHLPSAARSRPAVLRLKDVLRLTAPMVSAKNSSIANTRGSLRRGVSVSIAHSVPKKVPPLRFIGIEHSFTMPNPCNRGVHTTSSVATSLNRTFPRFVHRLAKSMIDPISSPSRRGQNSPRHLATATHRSAVTRATRQAHLVQHHRFQQRPKPFHCLRAHQFILEIMQPNK